MSRLKGYWPPFLDNPYVPPRMTKLALLVSYCIVGLIALLLIEGLSQ